jgi:hypothetical protein
MLCTLQKGFTGCSAYFPETVNSEETYPPFKIVLEKLDDLPHFTERTFQGSILRNYSRAENFSDKISACNFGVLQTFFCVF